MQMHCGMCSIKAVSDQVFISKSIGIPKPICALINSLPDTYFSNNF